MSTTATPVLDLAGAAYRYPGAPEPALAGIDLYASASEVVGLVGPNGAGKSTLLRVAAGLCPATGGTVRVLGADPARRRRREVAAEVAFVPSSLHVSFPMTVRDLVAIGRIPHLRGFFEGRRDRAAVERSLDLVHALSLADRGYDTLSAGEQKRVLVARALAQEPRLLLLDEPTANLDIAQGVFLLGVLACLARTGGVCVVAAIHDLNLALLHCDRIALLDRGRLVAAGEPEAVMRYDTVRRVFGCDVYIGRNEVNGKVFMVPMGGQGSRV
jgi:iron complex transport system ATP-binding protein